MWIKNIVNDLIAKHGTNNPFEIAEAKKIFVFERNLHEEILGFYKYIRRNKFIYINSNLSIEDKTFTCSHELGHSEIHAEINTPFLKRGTFFSIDKIEVEANRFAVELLMPDINLIEHQNDNLTIQEAASMYGVPYEVAHLKKCEYS